jgi:hypothetical protein
VSLPLSAGAGDECAYERDCLSAAQPLLADQGLPGGERDPMPDGSLRPERMVHDNTVQ